MNESAELEYELPVKQSKGLAWTNMDSVDRTWKQMDKVDT